MNKISRRKLLKKMALVSGSAGLGMLGMREENLVSASSSNQAGQTKIYLPAVMRQSNQQTLDPSPPAQVQRLIFIHHSVGQQWLEDNYGGLGLKLRDNNYFVSDTNYEWGPISPSRGVWIGNFTDIGHWYDWFLSPERDPYLQALYQENGQHSIYSRLANNPGGGNTIIMFKSCFPNSKVAGTPTDPPTVGNNPLRGQDANSPYMNVANIKGIYVDLLSYFSQHQEKLFIVITAPPHIESGTNSLEAANARAVNNWLVWNWLAGYPYSNVAVFDYFNVLTSNGGSPTLNDLGQASGNHHRWEGDGAEHVIGLANNYTMYWGIDSHPTKEGDLKATQEFIALLNGWFNRWNNTR